MKNKSSSDIKEVSKKELLQIIENRLPLGKFICKDENLYVTCDNSNGEAWTEEFNKKSKAIKYLR